TSSGTVATTTSTLTGGVSGVLDQAHSPYLVTSNINVPVGQTLTLLPGVVIKMGTGLNFTVNGTLLSRGVSTNPVVITSIQDSSIGGDSIGNGSTGVPGQWGAFSLNNVSAATQLNSTVLRFGQQISLSSATPVFNQVTISSMSIRAAVMDV